MQVNPTTSPITEIFTIACMRAHVLKLCERILVSFCLHFLARADMASPQFINGYFFRAGVEARIAYGLR